MMGEVATGGRRRGGFEDSKSRLTVSVFCKRESTMGGREIAETIQPWEGEKLWVEAYFAMTSQTGGSGAPGIWLPQDAIFH